MTTREYFRHLRGELWQTDPGAAAMIDEIATALVYSHSLTEGQRVYTDSGLMLLAAPWLIEHAHAHYHALAEQHYRELLGPVIGLPYTYGRLTRNVTATLRFREHFR